VVHTYSQRCDVDAGQSGGGWSVTPYENWALAAGDQVVWDTVLEFPDSSTNFLYRQVYGLHDGSAFPYDRVAYDYNGTTKQFAFTPAGNPNGATWHGIATDYGPGPNGGRLWRFVTSCVVPDSVASGRALAYLLASNAPGFPARTVYIHNHVAYRLTSNQGRIFGDLPFVLVGSGQTPLLSNEDISFPGPFAPSTVVARLDHSSAPLLLSGARVFATVSNDLINAPSLSSNSFGRYPPSASFGSIDQSIQTLAVTTDANRLQTAYRNGAFTAAPSAPIDDPGPSTAFRIGRLSSGDKRSPLIPFRRLQVYNRTLTAAEHAALHAALVAAET
jgi:hypothetical protein